MNALQQSHAYLLLALRQVRTDIRKIKRTTTALDEVMEICIRADKRATDAIEELERHIAERDAQQTSN